MLFLQRLRKRERKENANLIGQTLMYLMLVHRVLRKAAIKQPVLQRLLVTDFFAGEGDLCESARVWLLDDEPTDAPLTFEFICEALDLDLGNLRSAIAEQGAAMSRERIKEAAVAN